MTQYPTFAGVADELARHGIPIPEDLVSRIADRIPHHPLAAVEGKPATEAVVSAWLSTKGAPGEDELAWIVLLETFRQQFDRTLPGLREVLEGHDMGITRTKIEVRRQLGSRYLHLDRRIDAEEPRSPAGSFLLGEALTVLLWVDAKQPRLPQNEKRKYHSQIATASVIVARSTDDAAQRKTLLDQAARYSRSAEGFGDRSEEHFAYRAEIELRRYVLTRDAAPLEELLETVDTRTATTRRLIAAWADLRLAVALVAVRNGDKAAAVDLLHSADRGYSQALTSDDESGVAPGYLKAKRGRVHEAIYRYDTDSDGRRDRSYLDDAIADWRDPDAADHFDADQLVGALLDRARINLRANDSDAANRDREQARALMSAPSARTEGKFVVDELERGIEDAVAADDAVALTRVIDATVSLPAESAIPAAALMRATRVLLQTANDDDAELLAIRALHRLEVEIDHPALTPVGRRHIAGHAALLSWMLTRRSEDIDGLTRTVDLYRRSFESVEHHTSVDALSNAGTCALSLARQLLAGDEGDAEQAASLFTEATLWLGGALDLASRKPGLTRDNFDTVIAHSRCGEAAVRGYPITRRPELLDLAITHLEAARSAGQNAVELIGLLADAYYRRGTRDRSPDDLYRAVELKDDAFAVGNATRENRSVTAAVALRLRDLTHDDGQLTSAARRALQAAECDPSWPWAILQLSLIAADHQYLDADDLAKQPPIDLSALVVRGERSALRIRAAELAVATTEFRTTILGGQERSGEQGVRVINDPHRLVESALVLKRLKREAAHRERSDTDAFGSWLDGHACPAHWRLPEPLAVIDVGDTDAVYVMSREQGRVLGACVVDAVQSHDGPAPLDRFTQALHYLAAYQAWRWEGNPKPHGTGHIEQTDFRRQLKKAGRRFGHNVAIADHLSKSLAWLADSGAPVVAKKDPHPGNWLWTPTDHLVMIDVESSMNLPLLQEAVTVIDDLPLLDTIDPAAWSMRLGMAAEYCKQLQEFGVPIPDLSETELRDRYEALATLHAIKGLGRVRHADIGASLFSITTTQVQTTHYRGLLNYLAEFARSQDVRNLAAAALARENPSSPATEEVNATAGPVQPDRTPSFDASPRQRRGRRASRPAGPPR